MSHDDVDGQGNDRLVAIAQFLKPQEVFIHLHRRQKLYDFSRCIIARTEMSRFNVVISLCIALTAGSAQGQNTSPILTDGAITYFEAGQRKQITVGKTCADLWVSPDGSVIAFIAIEELRSFGQFSEGIEQSSIYIAKKVEGF